MGCALWMCKRSPTIQGHASHLGVTLNLWRGSLLPLGCEAAPKDGTATQFNGSKLPRHSDTSLVLSLAGYELKGRPERRPI